MRAFFPPLELDRMAACSRKSSRSLRGIGERIRQCSCLSRLEDQSFSERPRRRLSRTLKGGDKLRGMGGRTNGLQNERPRSSERGLSHFPGLIDLFELSSILAP